MYLDHFSKASLPYFLCGDNLNFPMGRRHQVMGCQETILKETLRGASQRCAIAGEQKYKKPLIYY
jgi:hypothetical protein